MKIIKLVVLTFGFTLLATKGFAGSLDRGSRTVQFGANLDFDTPLGTNFATDFGYGVLYDRNIEIGGQLSFETNDFLDAWELGAYGNYYIPQTASFVPYLGGGLGFGKTDIDYGVLDEDNSGMVLSGNAGALMFVTSQLAVDGRVNLRVATDDLYAGEDEMENTDFRLLFGLKYFF